MKKLLFFAAAMLVLALPAANAQKVNTVKEVAKLEKADATLQDVKKNTKAATWNAHGKAYTDAYMLPTKDLMRNIPIHTLMNAGAPIGQEEGVFAGTPVIVVKYEYVDVYVDQNMFILGWKQLMSVKEGLAETAIASYKKAYELDPKLGEKINVNATTLANALIQQGEALNNVNKTLEAAKAFLKAQVLKNNTELNTAKTFDVPAQIIESRTMVPLRAIFEALGASVEWDNDTRTLYIDQENITCAYRDYKWENKNEKVNDKLLEFYNSGKVLINNKKRLIEI